MKIPKEHGADRTKIQGKVLTDPPIWASAFKVYVTETSTCEDKADGLSAVACFKFKNLTRLSKPQNDFDSDVRT